MVSTVRAGSQRIRLRNRYLARRWPSLAATEGGQAEAKTITARAGRFAAAQSGCQLTFADLAAMPEWDSDPALDRERLALFAGLVAAAPTLLRSLDGAALRRLADQFGEELIDRVLDECGDLSTYGIEPQNFAASQVRENGAKLLEDAREVARNICARAWQLYQVEEAEA